MTNEELNTLLYEKMSAEQIKYTDWLLSLPPQEILHHTYEYTVREDILMIMENADLSDQKAQALLQLEAPLADVYKAFSYAETSYMDTLRDVIDNRANEVIRDLNPYLHTPVYLHPAAYAREHGELEQYRASYQANVACKEAIEAAVREHYHDNRLGARAVRQVVDAFGYDRTLHVLAVTVRHKDWDARISREHKEWAKTMPIHPNPDAWGNDRNVNFVVDKCHPGLTDLFVTQTRREYEQSKQQKKPSILAALRNPPASTAPKISAKLPEQEI